MPRVLWVQRQDIGPGPSAFFTMCYDSTRKRTILFNGGTWEWDGDGWTQVEDMGPGHRSNATMVFDQKRGVAVFFGGYVDSVHGDTWEWDGASWVQLADSGPAPRIGHAMAYDAGRGRTLLFGGYAPRATRDTWEWDGVEWLQRDETGPAARAYHAMAYDARRNRTVLFGGLIGATESESASGGDTWEWNGSVWTQMTDMGPAARCYHRMNDDGTAIVLFGGGGFSTAPPSASRYFGDTWEWDGRHWRQTQDIGPGARYGFGMSYDAPRQRMVLFGGILASTVPQAPVGDTWERYVRPVADQP